MALQREFEIKTPSLAASTELLVMAPIKPGFVDALDTVTYKSRVKVLLEMLHAGRQSQHEYRPLRALSDAVERVGVIRSLRVTVVDGRREEDDRILLSVHFDGSYEAYVRTIWQKSARLLDLIFCNAAGYPTGWDHPFDDWNAWIRSVQVPTPFFYATPGITYQDQTYLLMLERRDRGGAGGELDRTRIAVPTAEEIAWSIAQKLRDPTKRTDHEPASSRLPLREAFRQSLSALAGIYRLADWYRPGTPDGDVLLHAAHELMPQLVDMFAPGNEDYAQGVLAAGGEQLAKQLAWFRAPLGDPPAPPPPVRAGTRLPSQAPRPDPPDDVQGGILDAYEGVTDGVLCLLAFDDAAAAGRFLKRFETTKASDPTPAPAGTALANLALTLEGLRVCGLAEGQLQAWPLEFRQGMAARAGLMGDVRWNHPRRWTLPRLNWPASALDPGRDDAGDPALPLESVHAVVQFRIGAAANARGDAPAALARAVRERVAAIEGVRVLSLQWLARQTRDDGHVVDHFGYTDGQSQPEYGPNPRRTQNYNNQVHLGEVLVGYPNAADRADDLAVNRDPESRALMRNGSFLVVRKLRQDVAAFSASVAAAAAANGTTDLEIRARMMGRWPVDAGADAGKPLARLGDGGLNDFDFRGDETGNKCPLGAHIRRANPRVVTLETDFPRPAPGGRPPRLVRRSLPYGRAANDKGEPVADRGLLFMAYNASLAEQFEVVQGWLAGGNSSGGYSGTTCPFLGVPELGRERNFRFALGDKTVQMPVDGSADLGVEPQPLVTLQWGLYAFAPSRSAQQLLARIASQTSASTVLPWTAERGEALIERLRRVEAESGTATGAAAWKAALEDPESLANFDSASVWAAVRQLHGGVLRIPYGVLVAAPELIAEVLRDEVRYGVSGYRQRLVDAGMGAIFLGRDAADPEYARLSARCNQAIGGVGMPQGFAAGRAAASAVLKSLIDHAIDNAKANDEPTWELPVDSRDIVCGTLATLCEVWFGIDDKTAANGATRSLFARGALDWTWQRGDPVFYPGHFTAASRATFQPEPTEEVLGIAAEHGQALTAALRDFIVAKGPNQISAPIAGPVLKDLWSTRPDDAVHTIAGAMMGFLPTTEGVMRRALVEWTRDGTLLDLAAQAGGSGELQGFDAAIRLIDAPLRRAMKFRPVPEQIWRTARVAHRLGAGIDAGEPIRAGDRLIVGQVSATHAQLDQGETRDVFAVFGGDRHTALGQPPTHACPGYEAAMGAMVGLLSALLDHAGATLGPSPAAGILFFRGETPSVPLSAKPPMATVAFGGSAEEFRLTLKDRPGRGQVLLAFGDSWMSCPPAIPPKGYDLRRALGDLGYDTSKFLEHAKPGMTMQDMAKVDPSDGSSIYATLREGIGTDHLPLAVLVDGGGNDFKNGDPPDPFQCGQTSGRNSPLELALRQKGSSPPINDPALGEFLAKMSGFLKTVIDNLAEACRGADGKQRVPIIVCAYDHPFPDGQGFLFLCPWLAPTFTRKGYVPPVHRNPEADAVRRMATFIDRLNDAYEETVNMARNRENIDVRMVRLTGVLAATPEFLQSGHKAVWGNELHANQVGFGALAQHLHDQALAALVQRARA